MPIMNEKVDKQIIKKREILELINRISDIKNKLDEINSRVEMIKVSELEYQSTDIIQYGKYRDKRTQEKTIKSISRTYGNTSGFNTYLTLQKERGERADSIKIS